MSLGDALELAFSVALIGLGATLLLDMWSLLLKIGLGLPFPNYAVIGRWIGNFPRGQFAHASMAKARAVAGEAIIGWTAHYVIGILYATLFVVLAGERWLIAPSVLPAIAFGIATLVAPFFILQPAMGAGVASAKAPNPNAARLRSFAAHSIFGFGLYLTALALSALNPSFSLR
jgi:hypothetical protein